MMACIDALTVQTETHERMHIHARCSQCVVHVSIAPPIARSIFQLTSAAP